MVLATKCCCASCAFDTPAAAYYHYPMVVTNRPASRGTYALAFIVAEPGEIQAGALGVHDLPAGCYIYVGSALGTGGLAGRLAHHLRSGPRPHWHVDYLAARWPVTQVVARPSSDRQECAWARRLLALPGATAPVSGFGSTDCHEGCPAHLIRLPDNCDPAGLDAILCGGAAEASS